MRRLLAISSLVVLLGALPAPAARAQWFGYGTVGYSPYYAGYGYGTPFGLSTGYTFYGYPYGGYYGGMGYGYGPGLGVSYYNSAYSMYVNPAATFTTGAVHGYPRIGRYGYPGLGIPGYGYLYGYSPTALPGWYGYRPAGAVVPGMQP
jgi:hypothetical protein